MGNIGLIASGMTTEDILADYPYLEAEDVRQSLKYGFWVVQQERLEMS